MRVTGSPYGDHVAPHRAILHVVALLTLAALVAACGSDGGGVSLVAYDRDSGRVLRTWELDLRFAAWAVLVDGEVRVGNTAGCGAPTATARIDARTGVVLPGTEPVPTTAPPSHPPYDASATTAATSAPAQAGVAMQEVGHVVPTVTIPVGPSTELHLDAAGAQIVSERGWSIDASALPQMRQAPYLVTDDTVYVVWNERGCASSD